MRNAVWLLKAIFFLLLASSKLVKSQDQEEEEVCVNNDTSQQDEIIEWIRSNGGRFSSKQEFRRAIKDDPTSYFGIFATEDIPKGELLTKVPWDCLIAADFIDEHQEELDLFYRDEDTSSGYFYCASTLFLIQEMGKGDDSFYSPYTNYLKKQPRGKIPSGWSNAAKDLLEVVVLGNDMLPPNHSVDLVDWWKKICWQKDATPMEELAFVEYHARADENLLVPLYDLYNHCSRDQVNTRVTLKEGRSQNIYALRDISEGEQLCFSYKESSHMAAIDEYYDTPSFLRDYGFVESFPQSWVFNNQDIHFTLEEDETSINHTMKVQWLDEPSKGSKSYLIEQLGRLQDVVQPYLQQIEKEVEEQHHPNPEGQKKKKEDDDDATTSTSLLLPTPKEMATIRQYFDALTTALSAALEAFPSRNKPYDIGDDDDNDGSDDDFDLDHDDDYEFEYDDTVDFYSLEMLDVKQGWRVADCHESFPVYNWEKNNPDWEKIYTDKSGIQRIDWVLEPGTEDTCFLLDNLQQVCSSNRAHHHDIISHFPTRYLDKVKRVAILGGGDSLLLQEMMRYDDTIELVVHLELDQKVPRTSLKYYASQPLFHDERVQWWFGDAAKTLLMLPTEYFGSFDLVYVDMSETVLSESVTDRQTVWEVIAQLVAPEGFLIKNELFHETLMSLFDHTILIYIENMNLVQSMAWAIGSNRNFLHPNTTTMQKWQNVETVLKTFNASPKDIDDHFKYVHDYRKNDARTQGKCSPAKSSSEGSAGKKEKRLAGILFILDAENASRLGDLEWPISEDGTLFSALKEGGVTPLSTISHSLEDGRALGTIFMREGVVVVRTWPNENYCAFDIQLWGAFDKLDKIKASVSKAVGSGHESLSSYRIMTSGMHGTATAIEDRTRIGPKGVNFRNCNVPKLKESPIDDDTIAAVVEESLGMIQEECGTVAILCGSHDEPCLSNDVLSKKDCLTTIPLWTCPSVIDIDPDNETFTQTMFSCEMELLNLLRRSVSEGGKLDAFVLDSSASKSIVVLASRIWKNPRTLETLLTKRFAFIATNLDESDGVRRDFLEFHRREMEEYGNLFRSEFALESSSGKYEMGFLSGGDPHVFSRLVNVTRAIEARTGIDTEIHEIEGGVERPDANQKGWVYTDDEYDRLDGEAQFSEQRPLAEQHVMQFKFERGQHSEELFREVALAAVVGEHKDAKFHSLDDSGFVMCSLSSQSVVAVVVAYGRKYVDFNVNVFAYETKLIEKIMKNQKRFLKYKNINITLLAYDKMPRGVGRVVNLWSDLDRKLPL